MQKQGLIIENVSNMFIVKESERLYSCTARGKLKQNEVNPTVGDIVSIEVLDEEKGLAIINEVEQRKTYIKRPKISNISQIVLVMAAKHPKPDLLMLDKQLAYAELMKINPVIVINKIDLVNEEEIIELEKIYTEIGYTVIKTNAITKVGIDKVKEILKNNISVFSGNSGVGKSTLINSIFNDRITQEGNISIKNKKGRNTTTYTKLYEIDNNSYIADAPGFSTFEIDEIETINLDKYFIEFRDEIKNCEFIGCTHIKEENCGIKQALNNGKISKQRYDNYIKIYEDLKQKEEHKW